MSQSQATPGGRSPLLVLIAGSAILLVMFGTRQSYSVLMKPMTADLGWTRESYSLALGLSQLTWGLAQPLAGALAVKYGAARIGAISALVSALGMIASAYAPTPLVFQLTAGMIVGTFGAGSGFAVILAALAQAYPPEKRTLVMGVGTSVASLGQFVFVPMAAGFIDAYGWHLALVIMGSFGLLAAVFSGALPGRQGAAAGHQQSWSEATREALGHSGFRLISAAYFVCGFHVAFIGAHLPAYLNDKGLDPRIGAWAIAMIGAGNVIGSFASGALGMRMRKRAVLAAIYFLRAVVILAFISFPVTVGSAMAFAMAMGLLWLSTVPLTTGIVGQVFGMQHFAMLNGIAFMLHQVGAIIGVWLGGRMFDATGSYDVAWWVAIGLGVFAALCCLPADDRTIVRSPQGAMR